MLTQRKLAAILSADVAGYSRLMADDEAATLGSLNEARKLFRERIESHGGRLIDTAGDSVLAEFLSAVEGVNCAVEIQREIEKRNAQIANNRRMQFRIGINLGDILGQEDGTIYGDGVNVAARLQALAEPGGICISGTAFDQIEGKLSIQFKFVGEQAVKNIAKPIRTYRALLNFTDQRPFYAQPRAKRLAVLIGIVVLVGGIFALWQSPQVPSASVHKAPDTTPKVPKDPSIAVLPFQNMSGKPEDEWFADGMTETLITDLSRLDRLFVIARNSTFTYKGKPVDVRRVGQELGVRYVLEGSVQRTPARLRVNAQLLEADTGQHLWAERYDRKLADLFEIQDDLTQRIVTELDVKLLTGEQARIWRKGTRNREAYDLFLRGWAHMRPWTREDFALAQELFQQALKLDPKFAMALVELGWTHYNQGDAGWSADAKASYLKAVELGRKAVALDPSLGDAYAMIAVNLLTLERHAEAIDAAERALAVSPNQADTIAMSGWVLALVGRADAAIPLVERAIRLNPVTPYWYFGAMGDSLLFANRIEEALASQRKCVEPAPDFLWCQLGLTVTYVESGKVAQATAQAKIAMNVNSKITASDNTYVRSLSVPKDRARAIDALRRAGLK